MACSYKPGRPTLRRIEASLNYGMRSRMTDLQLNLPWHASDPVAMTLATLYAQTVRTDPAIRDMVEGARGLTETDDGFYAAMREAFMPVTPDFGALLYQLIRATQARTVVEYGTSFGLSTLFLAGALRDLVAGHIITTEIEPAKAARARQHWEQAGVSDRITCRIGNARQTLAADLPATIDFVLLDGAKTDYLPVLKLLEPRLRASALICADNTGMTGARAFVDYVEDPANGYVSAALGTLALNEFHPTRLLMWRGAGGHA